MLPLEVKFPCNPQCRISGIKYPASGQLVVSTRSCFPGLSVLVFPFSGLKSSQWYNPIVRRYRSEEIPSKEAMRGMKDWGREEHPPAKRRLPDRPLGSAGNSGVFGSTGMSGELMPSQEKCRFWSGMVSEEFCSANGRGVGSGEIPSGMLHVERYRLASVWQRTG